MNIQKLLDVRGTKYAYLGLAMIANLVWAVLLMSAIDWILANYATLVSGIDVSMMLGMFLGALAIAFGMSQFANDGRGVTYGIYGGLAGMVVVVILTFSSGLLAALVGLATLLGGFNGGTLGEGFRRARRKKP